MVFFNYTTMQMTAKIVYYGPGLCGKTTNLQFIHQKTASKSRGEMISLETETDRTLFFDLLPLDVGVIGGMKVRLQLYTVPGQVFYNATRKLVLKGVDGIVFVADSQVSMLDSNVESLKNLEANMAELSVNLSDVPVVFQFNKRDIRNIHPVDKLNQVLNVKGGPFFEAAALHGIGVFETLKSISRLALTSVRKKVVSDVPKKPAATIAAAPTTQTPTPVPATAASRPSPSGASSVAPLKPAPAPAPTRPAPAAAAPAPTARARPAPGPAAGASPTPANPLAELLTEMPPAEEIPVEFAEEDTDKGLRAVQTRGQVDIQSELEKLRTLTSNAPSRAAAPAASGPSKDVERRLQDMLVPDRESRQEIKRKASIDVPTRLLKGASEVKIHLGFDGGGQEEIVREAVTIRLVGNKRLERLTLHIDLELKGKG